MSLYTPIKSKPAKNPPNPWLTPAHHYPVPDFQGVIENQMMPLPAEIEILS